MNGDVPAASAVTPLIDCERLRAIVLVRVACAAQGVMRSELIGDLLALLERLPAAQGRQLIERELDGLLAAGLLGRARHRLLASKAAASQAAVFLGLKGELARSWRLGEARLIAKALGLERETAKRIQALATPEGLRIGVVQHAYQLKLKGLVTHARLRAALAAVALSRAFGDQLDASLAGKLALSARAERLLAGQLARKRRDFGTDRRLIAALAAEQAGLARADPAALRSAVLARYLAIANGPIPARQRTERAAAGRSRPLEPARPAAGRPDLASFAREVRALALGSAQGWLGDRKAYISHVWRRLRERRPEWGLSEIEFKCMLAQAHRSGELLLAIADLKDHNNLRDVQESALVYKNAVFHFVRVGV